MKTLILMAAGLAGLAAFAIWSFISIACGFVFYPLAIVAMVSAWTVLRRAENYL